MITRRDICIGASAVGLLAGNAFAQGKVIRVPFELSKDLKPIIQVMLNGKGPYRFMLDTGASMTVMRRSLGAELGLVPGGDAYARSVKGSERVVRYVVPEVIIGSALKMREWEVYASEGIEKFGFDGLLAADLLLRLPCQLDYQAREIRYYLNSAMPLEGFAPLKSYFRTNIRGFSDSVIVDIGFAGHALSCLLDTGAATPLFVHGDYVRQHKLWDKYPTLHESSVIGVNGKSLRTRVVEVKDIQIGGVWVPRMAVTLGDPDDRAGHAKDAPYQGLLGSPFLSGFVLAVTPERTMLVKSSGQMAALAPPEKPVESGHIPASTVEKPVIPFQLGEDRRLIFRGQVGDKPVLAFLKTGQGVSTVGEDTASALGLKKVAGGYDGSVIDFAGTKRPGLVLKAAKVPKAAIMLGADFLTSMPCALNFEHRYMTLFVGATPDTTGYEKTAMTRDASGRLTVPSRVAGKNMSLIYDTSVAYGAYLPAQTVKAHAFWDAAVKPEERSVRNGDAVAKARFGGLSPLEIGVFRIDPAPVTMVDPAANPDTDADSHGGWVGIGVIRRFDMVIDAQGAVWLKPNALFDYTAKSLPAKA
ncbi:aspartyl protease family protein [Asticcacaulis sp. YBE204]|uniref:aspartyl protease family protein n=1 Tax=Asticcacaulis sp. YBE204 TaxID=1282363 RepID=UPI0003C3B0E7|nr:aspartyl protease family protein [Asticcacaulis sp. YBE204]ESQ79907.1 hypothetical protein AEYBE204_08655 [Asticcacaulis sp. YBE204]